MLNWINFYKWILLHVITVCLYFYDFTFPSWLLVDGKKFPTREWPNSQRYKVQLEEKFVSDDGKKTSLESFILNKWERFPKFIIFEFWIFKSF